MNIENNSALQSTLNELAHLLINPSRLKLMDGSEVGSGAYGEVFFATLDGSEKVAVKQLRIVHVEAARIAMRVARELKIWAKVNHPNVLKLVGYYLSDDYGRAQFVSPYMPNGNITDYMKRTQAGEDARLGFVRDITLGMAYLHSCGPPICHGDLKPANVLINNEPAAVLCDFGLATFVEVSGDPSGLTTSRSTKGSTRYMSPELFETTEAKHTLESDVWAWACTVFEIITNCTPYSTVRSDGHVILSVTQGAPPAPMESLTSLTPNVGPPLRSAIATLQLLIPECWSVEPIKRPTLHSILERLQYAGLQNPPSGLSPEDLLQHEGPAGQSAIHSTDASFGAEQGPADLETVLSINDTHTVHELSFSPNGQWLATIWTDGQARLWNMKNTSLPPISVPNWAGKFRWSPDSRYLVTPVFSGIQIWSAESQSSELFSVDIGFGSVAWLSNGEDLVICGWKRISVVSFKSGRPQISPKWSTIHPPFTVQDMASIPIDRVGGRKIVVMAGWTRKPDTIMEWLRSGISSLLFKGTGLIVYDTDARKALSRVELGGLGGLLDSIAISKDGEFALITDGWKPQLWRLGTSDARRASYRPQFVLAYSFGLELPPIHYPIGRAYFGGNHDEWVISTTSGGDIYVWDTQASEALHVTKVLDLNSRKGRNLTAIFCPIEETGILVSGTRSTDERSIYIRKWRDQLSKPT